MAVKCVEDPIFRQAAMNMRKVVAAGGLLVSSIVCMPVARANADGATQDHSMFARTSKYGVGASVMVTKSGSGPAASTRPLNRKPKATAHSGGGGAPSTFTDCGTGAGRSFKAGCAAVPGAPCPQVAGQGVHAFGVSTRVAYGKYQIGGFCPGVARAAPPAGAAAPAAPPAPQVTAAVVRASVVKALPTPVIASAPPAEALPLVNVQVITWLVAADGQVGLGSAVLLGHTVDFRGQVKTVQWSFGDGSTATSTGPGRSYDLEVNPCRDYLCPGYFGHVYRHGGPVTITASATWTAQFRVDGGAWVDVGVVQGRVGQLQMTIHTARAVLVNR